VAPVTGFVDLTLDDAEETPLIKKEPLQTAGSVAVAPPTEVRASTHDDEHEEDLEGELKRLELQRQRIENEERRLEAEQRLKKLRRAKGGTSATPAP